MIMNITLADFKKLWQNQQNLFPAEGPITTRATFKLSELEFLIEQIRKSPGYEPDRDDKHSICITFVREKIGDITLLYDRANKTGHQEVQAMTSDY